MIKNEVDYTNIFESYIAVGIFITDIIEKVVSNWKKTGQKDTLNRENLEDFFFDEFQQWLELGLQEWCNEEWEDEEE